MTGSQAHLSSPKSTTPGLNSSQTKPSPIPTMHITLSPSPLPEYPSHFIYLVSSFLNFKSQLRPHSPPGIFSSPSSTQAEFGVPALSSLHILCTYTFGMWHCHFLVYTSVFTAGLQCDEDKDCVLYLCIHSIWCSAQLIANTQRTASELIQGLMKFSLHLDFGSEFFFSYSSKKKEKVKKERN